MTSPGTTTPPRLPIPSGASLSVRINQSGQEAVVVMGGTGPVLQQGMGEQWVDAFWAAFAPLIVGTASCTGATLRDVSGPEAPVYEIRPPASPNGTGGAQVAVASGCTLIKWSTATGGRTGKGRTYLPGLSQTQLGTDGRSYQAAYSATVQARIAAYLASTVFSSDFKPAVLSYRRGAARVITGGALAPVIGTQRRRMR